MSSRNKKKERPWIKTIAFVTYAMLSLIGGIITFHSQAVIIAYMSGILFGPMALGLLKLVIFDIDADRYYSKRRDDE